MSYTLDRNFPASSFDDVVARTRKALADQGFGVLTEIDVKSTLKKKKIGAEVDDYLILGACNPGMAHQAMQLEPRIGAMLPCNVILRKVDDGVEVSAVDPVASMTAVENDDLKTVARDVRAQLSKAVDAI
ncbi:DUF302 domain-containing protein [Roseibium salinum]|nr:DUF302 domain-containing protein [Roseibium salinum]